VCIEALFLERNKACHTRKTGGGSGRIMVMLRVYAICYSDREAKEFLMMLQIQKTKRFLG